MGKHTAGRVADAELRVDPAACDGIGICAHLAPDLISVDSWGYPMIEKSRIGRQRKRQASAAIAACPRRALWLNSDGAPGAS